MLSLPLKDCMRLDINVLTHSSICERHDNNIGTLAARDSLVMNAGKMSGEFERTV